jgi:hypothetical protein
LLAFTRIPETFCNAQKGDFPMNRNFTTGFERRPAIGSAVSLGKHALVWGALAVVAVCPSFAQDNALQEKVAAIKQSMAENTQRLRGYQWVETTQLTLKGDPKPPSQDLCRYGPDGKVQKTAMTAPPPPPSGGRMKQKVIEKKKEEMKDYMGDVKALIGMYVPPNAQRIDQARQAGTISLNPAGGVVNLVIRDYLKPGDQLTLSFDTAAKKITSIDVNTYMDQPKEVVTLRVQMGSLPDGTSYVQQTVLNATAKNLVATTTNANYQKLGG